MKIGDLARQTEVSIRMLRYYEQEGLLTPSRTVSGYRDYGIIEKETVDRIKMLSASGMTLPMILKFLPCAIDARGEFEPCDELTNILIDQIEHVDQRTKELRQARHLLSSLLRTVDNRELEPRKPI